VEVDVSSEFRYRHAMLRRNTVVVAISQSGETADTLEAIRIARRQGAKVVSIVNVVGSSIARESEGLIYTHAGPEIGVASTKAYTSQLMALSLFALYLGRLRGAVSNAEVKELLAQLGELPDKVEAALKGYDALEGIARNFKYIVAHSALYLGRTFNYPTALEGALKLKEISYIHAEGYAAGEMKHGPIALVTDAVPSICVAVKGEVYDKMVSNMQEIRARRGIVLAIATEGDAEVREYADEVIYVPACAEAFSPIVTAIPIQLFAYEIATKRGCDVDQPRNLAKSVTVE
jgi:glucosamine--fructose-6-phosphate aminotransferase (isomerizing)